MDANENELERIVLSLEEETIQMKEEISSIYSSVRMCTLNRREYCT